MTEHNHTTQEETAAQYVVGVLGLTPDDDFSLSVNTHHDVVHIHLTVRVPVPNNEITLHIVPPVEPALSEEPPPWCTPCDESHPSCIGPPPGANS